MLINYNTRSSHAVRNSNLQLDCLFWRRIKSIGLVGTLHVNTRTRFEHLRRKGDCEVGRFEVSNGNFFDHENVSQCYITSFKNKKLIIYCTFPAPITQDDAIIFSGSV